MANKADKVKRALIMAAGLGERLRPLTETVPKPMLPIGRKPIIEYIIEKLRKADLSEIYIATFYLQDRIKNYFGDGSRHRVSIKYLDQGKILGSAGALRLMPNPGEPIMVINGDIVSDLDLRAMLRFHDEHRAALTMAVWNYEVEIPYGVVQTQGRRVREIVEKPQCTYPINAGAYVLNEAFWSLVPEDSPFDMTELIARLVTGNQRVMAYPFEGLWIDIGLPEEYEEAQREFAAGRIRI